MYNATGVISDEISNVYIYLLLNLLWEPPPFQILQGLFYVSKTYTYYFSWKTLKCLSCLVVIFKEANLLWSNLSQLWNIMFSLHLPTPTSVQGYKLVRSQVIIVCIYLCMSMTHTRIKCIMKYFTILCTCEIFLVGICCLLVESKYCGCTHFLMKWWVRAPIKVTYYHFRHTIHCST